YRPAGNLCLVDLTALNPIAAVDRDKDDKPKQQQEFNAESQQTLRGYEFRGCVMQRWLKGDRNDVGDRWYSLRVQATYFPDGTQEDKVNRHIDAQLKAAREPGHIRNVKDGPSIGGLGQRAIQMSGQDPISAAGDPQYYLLVRNENLVLEVSMGIHPFGLKGNPPPRFVGDPPSLLQSFALANLTTLRSLPEN
ncbi:hypothetical protein, partial [Rhizocola hellebori]|uniref:hypothetical protein n=1 Tax=Rhizocola hellebori TaxID=1392758 RepID=UPI00194523A7